MEKISRRDFLKIGASLAAAMSLSPLYHEGLAEGAEELASGRQRILWLQGQSCTGCSVSFLNTTDPSPSYLVTRLISLAFHPTVSATQGEQAVETVRNNIQNPGYILVFEGSIPMGMPRACMWGDKPLEETLLPAVQNAKLVVAIGTCAVFGGMPAAEGNPTGAASLQKFMEARRVNTDKLLALPTCPEHPEGLVGTLVYCLKFGMPEKDAKYHRPLMFYSCSVHAECPRYHHYQNSVFASEFGDEHGCLFKLGCLGPLSYANCPRRQWNNGINWCIRANAPCLSCSSEYFCTSKDLPFYRKGEAARAAQKGKSRETKKG
jgi:hydrogenase small subunit